MDSRFELYKMNRFLGNSWHLVKASFNTEPSCDPVSLKGYSQCQVPDPDESSGCWAASQRCWASVVGRMRVFIPFQLTSPCINLLWDSSDTENWRAPLQSNKSLGSGCGDAKSTHQLVILEPTNCVAVVAASEHHCLCRGKALLRQLKKSWKWEAQVLLFYTFSVFYKGTCPPRARFSAPFQYWQFWVLTHACGSVCTVHACVGNCMDATRQLHSLNGYFLLECFCTSIPGSGVNPGRTDFSLSALCVLLQDML